MKPENLSASLLAFCHATPKKKNEDFSGGCSMPDKNVVMVADGIGSSPYAARASKEILKKGLKYVKKRKEGAVDLKKCYAEIQKHLDILIDSDKNTGLENSYGATLITAIETQDKISIGYTGNGAILHIRGNITAFDRTVYYLPWACVNYLNPHTVPHTGKPALYKHFGADNEKNTTIPSIIDLTKDKDGAGDIIVICTDGIHSQDHMEVGLDEDNKLWIQGSQSVRLLLQGLQNFLKAGEYSNASLTRFLTTFKKQLLREKELVSDDFAIGILITKTAINYQKMAQDAAGNH